MNLGIGVVVFMIFPALPDNPSPGRLRKLDGVSRNVLPGATARALRRYSTAYSYGRASSSISDYGRPLPYKSQLKRLRLRRLRLEAKLPNGPLNKPPTTAGVNCVSPPGSR